MKWHYQIAKFIPEKGDPYFCIKEVYVEKNKTGWSKNPITPIGSSKKEIIKELKMMLNDAEFYPVMTIKESSLE